MCCHHMGMQRVAIKSNESLQPAQDFMDPAQGEDKSAEKPQGALHTTVLCTFILLIHTLSINAC